MGKLRIEAAQAHNDVLVADALLVCAYEEEEKFEEHRLENAISLDDFQSQLDELPKNREIIFYCDCPHDELSSQLAEKYHERGFSHAKYLEGGVRAWALQGFPVVSN